MTQKRLNSPRSKKKKFKFNFGLFSKLLVALFVVISIYYVVSANDIAIKGFVLNDLKTKVKKLNEENRNYELKIAELENFENINLRAQEMKMVKADDVEYITVINEVVAKK